MRAVVEQLVLAAQLVIEDGGVLPGEVAAGAVLQQVEALRLPRPHRRLGGGGRRVWRWWWVRYCTTAGSIYCTGVSAVVARYSVRRAAREGWEAGAGVDFGGAISV